jgi:benzoate membrane transport protein
VLVGYTSSAAIVFEAARALGASERELASWMGALGLGMALTCIGLSLRYRAPIVTAWSTPGAAMLVTGVAGVSMPEAIGAFVVAGALAAVAGFSGAFERAMARLPAGVAAGMLAGVLLRFGLEAFSSIAVDPLLVGTMLAAWLAGRRAFPRYAVPAVLAVGIAIAALQGTIVASGLALRMAEPVLVVPAFSWTALVGVAIPLFLVTMASQNAPGAATLRAAGYATPVSPLVGWTGVTTVVLAPFGGFAFNLAAITAAISMGPEAHPDPARRYTAAVVAGLFYLALGIAGATVGALFAAFPRALVVTVAGLALLSTIGNALATAMRDERERDPALVTFLVTASGVTLLGLGSAFWGLVAGALATVVLRRRG